MSRSNGHCNTMGTASTMGCIAEALGLSLPGSAAIPAVDGRRKASAQLAGRRIVDLVRQDLAISKIVGRERWRTRSASTPPRRQHERRAALPGAGRPTCIPLTLDDLDRNSRGIPLLANLVPNGAYLMEEFFGAGGLPALMNGMRICSTSTS